jgi:polyhydroxyalkanoate synthesis regulator phasin
MQQKRFKNYGGVMSSITKCIKNVFILATIIILASPFTPCEAGKKSWFERHWRGCAVTGAAVAAAAVIFGGKSYWKETVLVPHRVGVINNGVARIETELFNLETSEADRHQELINLLNEMDQDIKQVDQKINAINGHTSRIQSVEENLTSHRTEFKGLNGRVDELNRKLDDVIYLLTMHSSVDDLERDNNAPEGICARIKNIVRRVGAATGFARQNASRTARGAQPVAH